VDVADPLITSDQMVGEWDPDAGLWSARDWTPGPAGSVAIELPGGVELDVDVASPRTFVGLWVPAARGDRPDRTAARTVERLLGEDRARNLFELDVTDVARSLDVGRDDPYGEREPGRRFGQGTQPGPRGVHRSLAHLGLATTVLQDPAASGLARALARLEAATRLPRLGERDEARTHAEAGAAVLIDRWPEIGDTDPRTLARTLRRIERLLTAETAAAVRQLRADLDARSSRAARRHGAAAFDAASAPMALPRFSSVDAAARPVARLLRLDATGMPVPLQGREIAARAVRHAEAEVRIHGLAHDAGIWWARAFHPDGTMLAAAPFLADRADAVARLLVPPGALHDATYDITDLPGQPRLPSRMHAVAEAVGQGQAAARAERLALPHVAEERWQRSSGGWQAVGDKARISQARDYARGIDRVRDRVPPPLLADPVVEAGD
jgi:hypothetical protein